MLKNRKLRAKASVSLGLLVAVSLFSVPASAQFRPRPGANGAVVVFEDPNFRGASETLRGDTTDLRSQKLNDKVSSIEIPAGQTWEMCQDINYRNCQVLRGSVADLRSIGWDDRISSLRRIDGAFRNGRNQDGDFRNDRLQGLVFYDRTGYRGTAYDQGSIGNRKARSVEVRRGTWELCDRAGRCTTINRSVPDLSQLGLNGKISSARPVNNQFGQRGDPRYADPRDRNFGR
jgi:hypothetical protein